LSADDQAFQALLAESGRPVLPVLTKAAKVVRSKQPAALADRSRELGVGRDEIQLVSATTGQGIAELGESLLAAATPEAE
jgi:GTP-binding protein EngB required for normal cell division